jgi:hypothetical protein
MKLSRIKLVDLIPLREAEEEENPFGGGDEAAAEDAGEEEKDAKGKAKPSGEEPNVKFDVAAVKQYNNNAFTSDTGKIISASKDGLQVMVLPDEVPIFVNFQDVV